MRDSVQQFSCHLVSDLFRVARDEDSLHVDFMSRIDGARSLASLRSRASRLDFGGHGLWVADLADIKSKKAAGRPRDRIRRLLEKPPEERTHFLRKRIGFTASCL
jgi:hypothetical protein